MCQRAVPTTNWKKAARELSTFFFFHYCRRGNILARCSMAWLEYILVVMVALFWEVCCCYRNKITMTNSATLNNVIYDTIIITCIIVSLETEDFCRCYHSQMVVLSFFCGWYRPVLHTSVYVVYVVFTACYKSFK